MADYIKMSRPQSGEPFESALARPGDWAWEAFYGPAYAPEEDLSKFESSNASDAATGLVAAPDEDAKPCSKCGAWFLWCDGGGNRYCVECYPPPTILAVQKIIQCVVVDGQRCAIDATAICWPLWRERLKAKR